MHITKPDVTELSADGQRFQPDEEGRFDVPAHVGEWLIRVHGWEEAEPPATAAQVIEALNAVANAGADGADGLEVLKAAAEAAETPEKPKRSKK